MKCLVDTPRKLSAKLIGRGRSRLIEIRFERYRMSDDDRFAPKAPPHWMAPEQPPPSGVRSGPQETALNRFLGGSPGGVFLRLLFVSLIVGAFLMWLDI